VTAPIASILGGTRRELCSMTWDEYRAFPALNGSVLVHGRTSMKHLKYAWDHGRPDTDAMRYGRLLHCLLFEPAEVTQRYRAWTGSRRGNAWELFCTEAEEEGVEIVRAEGEYSLAMAIAATKGFLQEPRVRQLIAAGQAEQTVLAVEPDLQCKGRLDWVSTSEHILTDLKNSATITPALFGKAFFNYGYDIKLGLYKRWLEAATGERWPVEAIVLEAQPPHDVAIVQVPDAVLDEGVEKALRIIEQVRRCIETDEWPGVAGGDYMLLKVPFYEMPEETEEFQG